MYFSRNVDTVVASDITNRLNVAKTDNLGTYLGVRSTHGLVTGNHFNNLIDRIKGRMEGWKTRTLSLVGRVTLAKSVLTSIPMYTMQTTVLPIGVCNEIEKCTRRFIWGGAASGGTPHTLNLVKWD